jgi:D-aspartate ligase
MVGLRNKSLNSMQPHVVVLAGGFGALGIVRELGRQGIPITVLGRAAFVGKSKYCVFIETKTPDDILLKLSRLCHHPNRKPVLLTDNDVYMEMIYEHWDELSQYYRFPTHLNNRVLTDKTKLHDAAVHAGLPVPDTYSGDEQWDIETFPVIVKPIQRDLLWQQPFLKRVKAYQCNNQVELHEVLSMMRRVNVDSITQEIVNGDLKTLYCITLFRNKFGAVLIGEVVQKLGQFPDDYGTGTAMLTVNEPRLVEYSERLLASVNYIGIASIDYKRCPERDEFYLIEVNGRFPAYAGIMGKLGNRFAARLCADMIEPSRTLPAYREPWKPVLWLYLLNDIRWSIRRHLFIGLKYFHYMFHYRIQHATWDWRDPMPSLHYYVRLLKRLIPKRKLNKPLKPRDLEEGRSAR